MSGSCPISSRTNCCRKQLPVGRFRVLSSPAPDNLTLSMIPMSQLAIFRMHSVFLPRYCLDKPSPVAALLELTPSLHKLALLPQCPCPRAPKPDSGLRIVTTSVDQATLIRIRHS